MAKKTSLSNKCSCKTKSALDKNLKANANSKKPNEPISYTPNINEYLAWLKAGISKFKQ